MNKFISYTDILKECGWICINVNHYKQIIPLNDIFKWCKLNCKKRFSNTSYQVLDAEYMAEDPIYHCYYGHPDGSLDYWFEDETDAMAFKLRF